MSGSFILVAMLAVCLALASADPIDKSEHQTPENVMVRARRLVNDVRDVVVQAKSGIYLGLLRQNVLDLQTAASDLINLLPEEVSECETQFTIKMAAAGTGSHEVLTVLLANDELSILNGRLSLALAFLDHVAGQLEDELSLTSDVGPHLTAIVFGANVTLDIIGTADKTVKAMAATTHDGNNNNDNNNSDNNRVRRQIRTQFPVGRGWSVGTKGVQWDSEDGRYTFNARPTFRGFRPDGFWASFTIRF